MFFNYLICAMLLLITAKSFKLIIDEGADLIHARLNTMAKIFQSSP